jgi:Flp pilus assembly protein TadB
MAKEKVQNEVQTIQWLKKKYKIKDRQSNDQRKRTKCCTFSLVIGLSVLYFVLFLWSLDCLYFILYFFFGHWIVCPLFCTNPMTKEKVQNKVHAIQWPKKKDKIKYRQSNDQRKSFSLVIGLSVVYFVLFLWSLDCLYFILYFFFGHWIVCTLFCSFSLVIGLSVLYFVLQWLKKKYNIKYRQSNDQRKSTK